MHRVVCLLLAAVVAVAAGLQQAAAAQERRLQVVAKGSRRVALVIGNDRYPQMPLRNAVNDARAIAAALRKYGFLVTLALDTTYRDLSKTIDRFGSEVRPGDVALTYYAGHGLQVEGENYLVPVDFTTQNESDAKYESYPVGRIVDRLGAAGVGLNIVVLDACRNNPFRSTRSGTRGLAPMDSGQGTLIAFATAPNRTADDNWSGTNGLFTTFLLEAMEQPGLGVEQLFSVVRQKVYDASGGRQIPWLVSSVIGEFHFRAAAPSAPPEHTPPAPIVTAPPASGGEAARDPNVRIREQVAIAEQLVKTNRHAEARRVYEELLVEHPSLWQLNNYIARAYAAEGNSAKALEHARKSYAKDPTLVETKLLMAFLLQGSGEKVESGSILRSLDVTAANDPLLFINAAINDINDGKATEAIALLNKLVAAYPNNPELFYYRGRGYLAASKWDEAKADFEKFVAANPASAQKEVADAKKILDQMVKK